MRRTVTPELLDADSGTDSEIRASLADLRFVNRWFGGTRVMRKLIETVARGVHTRNLTLLDVGSGSGDVPIDASRALARRDIRVDVTLMDRAPTHLPRGVPAVTGDALALPFGDGSFDLVGCSLFVHHLEPDEVVSFVNTALRVCRHAVLINDLRRSAVHLAAVYAGMPLYRSRITRHDGPASVRRAYTMDEMRALLARTNAARIEMSRFYFFRMGAIVCKSEGEAAPGP
jgi:ubiquinone/menaquinone biosynthesis C-methylase UbiE